jgi:hypothetical protein
MPKKNEQLIKPKWVSNIYLPGEKAKITSLNKNYEDFQKGSQEYEEFIKVKNILYLYGNELSIELCNMFEKIGISSTLKEIQKRQDIEILHGDFYGIIEVKGLLKHADVDDIRELLDWWITESKTKPDVKGIFIVNHYRDKEPKLRVTPYTPHAIQLAENNKFCLMTTVDLFNIYCDFLIEKINSENIIRAIKNTSGIFKGH